ncbi:MAG: cell division protein SepF [Eubacteriales bacterium]
MNFLGKRNQGKTHLANDGYYDAELNTPTETASDELPIGKTIGSSIEVKVVSPVQFDEVSVIADYLLSGCTVFLNLEATARELTRRIIDFLSGVAYSIDGQIKRVTSGTYIITPSNVDVSEAASGETISIG